MICSSNAEVLDSAKARLHRANVHYYRKENRGRDISALLVAMRSEILKFDYFCFIHDKSPNAEHLKDDFKLWIENLWQNTLGSNEHVYSVIKQFEENDDLGILAPPEPCGEFYAHYYDNTWYDNYDNTVLLAQKIGLSAQIEQNKSVFMMGTVFWARTVALKKLLEIEWKYEDFPEEPLPIDGTFSHAVERIIGYVAQDAGYNSGTIMTKEYASWLLLNSQEYMRVMFEQLKKREHVFDMHQIRNLDEREVRIRQFFEEFSEVYIYGAGKYGLNMYRYLTERHMRPVGFIVSDGHREMECLEGLPVCEIGKIKQNDNTAILIAVSYESREIIEKKLDESGFSNYIYGY